MVTLQIEADTVPEILRATRNLAGLSTRQMGEAIGVSHSTVVNWEAAKSEPSVTQFIQWAQVTKQPAEQLLSGLLSSVRPKGLEPLTFWSVVARALGHRRSDVDLAA